MPVFDNNVVVILNTGISAGTAMTGAGTLVFTAASAPKRNPPDPTGEIARITLVDNAYAPTKIEVFTYTGRTGTGPYTLTGVTRAREGTSAQDFSAGATGFMDITTEILQEIRRRWTRAFAASDPLNVI